MTIYAMPEEDWQRLKQTYKQRVASIVIPLDMATGVGKGLLSRIDAFFSEVRVELGDLEGQRERIDLLIKELEKTAAEGTNETARKKAATEACQNYKVNPEETVNLYDLQRTLVDRAKFLYGITETLNGKHARIITVGGLLKLEKDLAPHATLD